MQTTLRISDDIYREAKAEAAREGLTLTRFLEEGLRLRLKTARAPRTFSFRVYDPGTPCQFSDADIRRIADEEQEKHDLAKLGISRQKAS
jgi:hypothetical protein